MDQFKDQRQDLWSAQSKSLEQTRPTWVRFIFYKWFIVKKNTKVNVWSLLVNN